MADGCSQGIGSIQGYLFFELQVRSMVNMILRLKKQVPLDASDALAAAICHVNSSRLKTLTQKSLGK